MNQQNPEAAWSLYWAQDRLNSCVAADSDTDQQTLNGIWQAFAENLSEQGKVLDLATGNGAVPLALLSTRPSLLIDAVDQAEIDPAHFLKARPGLDTINFHSNTDINQLPFEVGGFEAITSQFGIEYAGLHEATMQVLPYLQDGGRISFLIHSTDSEIIHSSAKKITELNQVLVADGLVDTLLRVLRGEVPMDTLESLGRAYIEGDNIRTEHISGQVFAGIDKILTQTSSDMPAALELAATLSLRLYCERERLVQMQQAARTDAQLNEYANLLEKNGIVISVSRAVYAEKEKNDYLLGWLIQGQKS